MSWMSRLLRRKQMDRSWKGNYSFTWINTRRT